jgi:hypothetical protein
MLMLQIGDPVGDDSGMAVSAVIFDYKTLLIQPSTPEALEACSVLQWLRGRGLRWCVFSTDPLSAAQQAAFSALGYPPPYAHIQKADILSGKNRGSPDWIDAATVRLGVARHELLYIGCTALDWRTAINSGVLYLHAGWAAAMPPQTTSLVAGSPADVREFMEAFLLGPSRWSFRLDGANCTLRSLLPASAVLPSTRPGSSFKLQDVFTYARNIQIAGNDARDLLMLFVLANAYLEGLLSANAIFCVYPGSRRGTISEQLRGYLDKAASVVHGYYREDLLVRASDAPDTSLARWKASQAGTRADVSIATQATTVHLGSRYRSRLRGKTVIVFDDFTTKGMSLEWARLLLAAAGAARIILVTAGKYGTTHTRYELRPGKQIDPYAPNTGLTAADFTEETEMLDEDAGAPAYFSEVIGALIAAYQQNPGSDPGAPRLKDAHYGA